MNRYESNMQHAQYYLGVALRALKRIQSKRQYDYMTHPDEYIMSGKIILDEIDKLYYLEKKPIKKDKI